MWDNKKAKPQLDQFRKVLSCGRNGHTAPLISQESSTKGDLWSLSASSPMCLFNRFLCGEQLHRILLPLLPIRLSAHGASLFTIVRLIAAFAWLTPSHCLYLSQKRNEFHIVKQTDNEKIIIADGQHDGIVSLEVWEAAQEKRKANAHTKEKIDKEHEYFLSGILKCPSCGGPMYGIHNGRKKIKGTDEIYPLSYSYACRSGSLETGRVCTKPQNYSENKLMDAITAIIKSLVNDKNFSDMVDDALDHKIDVSELEKDKARYQKEYERLERLSTQLAAQIDTLDLSSKAAVLKEQSLNARWNKALEDMADIQDQISDLDAQMEKMIAAEKTKKRVYTILQSFDVLFDLLDNTDKKLLIKELIEKIELYPREGRKQSGQWIKTIHFKFPMYYNDSNEPDCSVRFDKAGNFLPKESTDESICTLIRKED